MLYLMGNALMLTPNYRAIVKQRFNPLKILDGTPTLNENDSPKKRKKKAIDMGKPLDIVDNCSLDL